MLLSAFAIHTGGGAVLLDALLTAAHGADLHLIADARYRGAVPPAARVERLPPRLIARLALLWRLGRIGGHRTLLCFNGLPPLRRSPAHTITYCHAFYLVNASRDAIYPVRVRARHALERLLFRIGRRNLDEIWVQTESMAIAARGVAGGVPVRIMPFVAPLPDLPRTSGDAFIYPANDATHKNHAVLLGAWALLDKDGVRPPLILTLAPEAYRAILGRARLAALPHIVATGPLDHAKLLARLMGARALIFPSLLESFGLPLVEAQRLGVPILAPERDYVRDVCNPVETFDPESARSIANAVRRFLGLGAALSETHDGRSLLDAIAAAAREIESARRTP